MSPPSHTGLFVNVHFYQTDLDIFVPTELIPANPELYVISGCLRKLFEEPEWRVEVIAGMGGGTTTAIPDGVCDIGLIRVWKKVTP